MSEPVSTAQLITMFGVAGLAAAAIGTIIYFIVKSKNKEKEKPHSSSNSVRHNDIIYTYDPDSKSIVETAAPVTKKSDDSNLRQRHVAQNKNQSASSNEKKITSSTTVEVQTDPIDDNYNINQNVNNMKILNDKTFSYEERERVAEYIRNIPDEVMPENEDSDTVSCSDQSESSSWSNVSSAKSTDTPKKAYRKKLHKSFQKYVDNTLNATCERAQNVDENSDSASSVSTTDMSDWSDVSSVKSNDDFEKDYKRKVRRSLKKFVKNMKEDMSSKTPSECSSNASDISVIAESNVCIACEIDPVNTHTLPCNHHYLCSDCAMKFFKLSKRCKVCRAKIEQIVVED